MIHCRARLSRPHHPTFISVLHVLVLIAPVRSVENEWTNFKNLYGTENFGPLSLSNLLEMGVGGLNFLVQTMLFRDQQPQDVTPSLNSTYDFIVVGAGTAGATIASRLSEIADSKVLLLEAGPSEELIMDVPILVPYLQLIDQINWKYRTEPSDKYCTGLKDRRCNWPRGKVMGGSSVLNYMIATRASPADYDRWDALGNKGWAYKDVLKYFKKLENIRDAELRKDTKYRGTKGPVSISRAEYYTPVAAAFLEAGEELGYPLVDYNAEEMIGFSRIQATVYNGYRQSSNRAYLTGTRRRNLSVSKESLVKKVLFDARGKRAIGVQFEKFGRQISVYAKKEVILCAGAIGSAQLLMLSGIGPKDHLRTMGIPVLRDARVGDNLMDHIADGGLTFITDLPVTMRVRDMQNIFNPYIKDYLQRGYGPFTIPGGCDAIAFVDVDDPEKRTGRPNMEMLLSVGTLLGFEIMTTVVGVNDRIRKAFEDLRGKYTWTIFPMILQPKSRGWLRLRSPNVHDKPILVPNYMDDPEDVRLLLKGIRWAIKISQTQAMRRLNITLYSKLVPGCEHLEYDSDEYWICHLRSLTLTIYHYSGTCKMGPPNDATAVVDPRLKVIGVKGLRVVDASIMPEIISGHPNVPVFMIAEKGADMIKQDWGYPTDTTD